jgi:hypothetical protein
MKVACKGFPKASEKELLVFYGKLVINRINLGIGVAYSV